MLLLTTDFLTPECSYPTNPLVIVSKPNVAPQPAADGPDADDPHADEHMRFSRISRERFG
jgi:hypothetical protein